MSQVWSKTYQILHDKVPVYPAISNYRLAAGLQKGDTVHRQYPSSFVAKRMGADGSYSRQAIQDTDETLTIDSVYETSFYVKDLDALQADLPLMDKYAYRSMVAIYQQIDADVLGMYDQFTQGMDAGHISGTSGEGITATVANIKKCFFTAKKLLQRQNLMMDATPRFSGVKMEDDQSQQYFAVISPDLYQFLLEACESKESVFGAAVSQSGHQGMFGGFNILTTNQLGWSTTFSMVTQPTDGDTVSVAGVTWTFKTTLGTTAGNVLIGGSADAARANLLAAITNSEAMAASTVSTLGKYVELSDVNRALVPLLRVSGVNNNTTDKMTLKMLGYGAVTVSETLTDATDTFTATLQIQHALFGAANAIDVVIQKEPSRKEKDAPREVVGTDVITWTACGKKVFNEGKAMMIDARFRTDAY